ncbi:hypothetical protein AcV7_001301 [Taiwanofungus camphoratus]|nr:hypothetical protein AcV7_001301 [Antrodia cinnamomea]
MNYLAVPTVIHLASRTQRPDDTYENALSFGMTTNGNGVLLATRSPGSIQETLRSASPYSISPPPIHTSHFAEPSTTLHVARNLEYADSSQSASLLIHPISVGVTFDNLTDPVSLLVTNSYTHKPSVLTSFRGRDVPTNIQTLETQARDQPICIGDGLDVSSIGLLSTLVLPTVVGLLIWLLFAIIRPRFRQVYGLREWFVPQGLRPAPLGRSLLAFMSPNMPFIPSITADVSNAGKSAARDAELFPSDEELSLRTLWTSTLIVSGWTILGMGGLLPLYMVSTPCLARSAPPFEYSGMYSALQDLSLLRILQLLDHGHVTTADEQASREIVNGHDAAPNIRIRLIILTIFAIVLGLLPALWLIIREFNKMVAYRERWENVHCQGQELGWLSARQAPGLVGWGEKRVKEFFIKTGLSSSLEMNEGGDGHTRRRRRTQDYSEAEKARFEIDVQSLFSIGDTTQLALLIDERDEILENLEIAETKYIQSFRLSTPDPSIADYQPALPPISEDPAKPEISRPRPLAGSTNRRRRRRGRNPAFGSSSLPPTSYVMPSQYYKLRGVQGLSGGQFADVESDVLPPAREPSLAESFNQRVVGSRFQEVNSSSPTIAPVPMGSQVAVNKSGHLEAVRVTESPMPDPGLWGPNAHASWDTAAFNDESPYIHWLPHGSQDPILEESEEDWHDVLNEDPEAFENAEEYPEDTHRRPRPPRAKNGVDAHRETFPLRNRNVNTVEDVPPPHLRLQPRQPFVRPLSGLDHDTLSTIYADINLWRSKLKVINAEISEVQHECYNDIADGARIKGWLMIGRGLRFIPGVQLIEGRAKEDIRWDELQNEGGPLRSVAFWIIAITTAIMLGVVLSAFAGLAMSTAPDFAHYFPFLLLFDEGNDLGAGIATCLVPAVAATLFISLALRLVHYAAQLVKSISVSGSQIFIYKTIFWILVLVGGVWLFTVGAILFAMHSFSIGIGESESVANGIIYMSTFALYILLTVAIICPGLLMLQPVRLLTILRSERAAVTSRQRFRAVYPRTYNPSYALSCCVLAILYTSAFTLLFPLVAPAALLLLSLTFVAHRFLVGYVYGRTHSSTGGLLQIWLLRRFGTLLAFQPLLLGLILLSRLLWVEGGILCGMAFFVVVFVEGYCSWRTRQPGRKLLTPITVDCLETFSRTARPGKERNMEEESLSLVSSARNTRIRGSFASILEMMSLTLAVVPSPSETRGAVPLATETLDDLTATERAARTHPDAPPHLPPLPFADHAEEMAGILYAPELLAPPPVIWLTNDAGGIGRSEAYDLEKYHELRVTLDVRAKDDVQPQRSWPSQTRRAQTSS